MFCRAGAKLKTLYASSVWDVASKHKAQCPPPRTAHTDDRPRNSPSRVFGRNRNGAHASPVRHQSSEPHTPLIVSACTDSFLCRDFGRGQRERRAVAAPRPGRRRNVERPSWQPRLECCAATVADFSLPPTHTKPFSDDVIGYNTYLASKIRQTLQDKCYRAR